MLGSIIVILAAAVSSLHAQTVDVNGITLYEKVEAIERQLLDPFTLNSLVSPCSVNFGDTPDRGEQTSAQWVRIVFHDAITKNVAGPGTGGLDASISFESDREENIGVFVNITIKQFSLFSSPFLSMADLIGVGLSDSLATCDQPLAPRIPLRVGRMDAHEAGPLGVPGPLDSLAVAQTAFNRAGFTNSEMIQAIACGHSLGGVHHSNFPDIVPASQVTPTNLNGRASFDTSPANFNHDIVKEYLDGTTQNPLVVGPQASRSDFRIFNSDGNATISNMNSAASFRSTCHTIFTKMVNTVPNGIVLSDPVGPRPWILKTGRIDLTASGGLTYSGKITASGPGTRSSTAPYVYKNSNGGTVGGAKTSQAGVEFPEFLNTKIGLGVISQYDFSDNIATTVASITVANSYTRPINNNIFVSTARSFRNDVRDPPGSPVSRRELIVRAAVKTSLAVTGTTVKIRAWQTVPQANSLAPKVIFAEWDATLKETIGAYKIYQAVVIHNEITDGFPVVQAKLYSSTGTVLQASDKDDNLQWPECSASPLTAC